jgi:Domain of unknown function (4846)
MYFKILTVGMISFSCCSNDTMQEKKVIQVSKSKAKQVHYVQEIVAPEGYTRLSEDSTSFSYYLQHIGLKKSKIVHLYNGAEKYNQNAQFAVLDISVGNKDLQQCADAVMRLRAEYLYQQGKFSDIVFWDNEKTAYRFTAPYTRERLDSYLQKVFGMCGSASLAMQLNAKQNLQTIQHGDVFIKGGFPGHAVIVIDVAQNEAGQRVFMVAQSYMPAQDIHILKNPNNAELSPWYSVSEIGDYLYTPEYIFTSKQLRTW